MPGDAAGGEGGTGGIGGEGGTGAIGGEGGTGATGGEGGTGGIGGEGGEGGTGGEGGAGGACAPGAEAPCAVGDCQGTQRCADDGTWSACEGPAEVCNGADDNCDGAVDEAWADLGQACEVGVGACLASGTVVCAADGAGTTCDAAVIAPTAETCNGLDDDCNGTVDDGLAAAACETGQPGVCSAGVSSCEAGEVRCVPSLAPQAEVCNGLDDNCDGLVDEGMPGAGAPCAADALGVCAGGATACVEGAVVCVAGVPQPELCNGLDDNCDGRVDDAPTDAGAPCAAEGLGPCAEGRQVCARGALRCESVVEPVAETCNGVDDNCDGVVDNGRGVGVRCTSGVGACAVGGQTVCGPRGAIVCDAQPGAPSAEICDDIDNNCDGTVDEVCPLNDALVAGVQQDVPEAEVLRRGWRPCFTDTYAGSEGQLDAIQRDCAGDQLMLACRPVGADRFTLAAEGAFAEVVRPVGPEAAAAHQHNGVTWYYDAASSWGFAPGDQAVNRNRCDFGGALPEQRLCWHTGDGVVQSGFRCGDNSLNRDATWERVVLKRRFVEAGTFVIDDGPAWNAATSMSCVEACGEIFHGTGWGCSTDPAAQNHRAHGSHWGGGDLCAEADAHEQHVLPADRGYNCGEVGCSFSAYVDDHCGPADINRCWRAEPLSFSGVQQDLPEAALLGGGFEPCWSGSMVDGGVPIADVRAACTGDVLVMGCRAVGEPTLRVSAMGTHAAVFRDVGDAADASHQHNGVTWYFSEARSWGFAPGLATVSRSNCDFSDDRPEQRMCWHTRDGNISAGWSCGATRNGANDERVIYQRSGAL